ncbi:MAG: hypothetical protein ACRENP_23610 [Longimicrobiales bacterium]
MAKMLSVAPAAAEHHTTYDSAAPGSITVGLAGGAGAQKDLNRRSREPRVRYWVPSRA